MEGWIAIDTFLYPCISRKLEELNREIPETWNYSFLACFLKGFEGTPYLDANSKKFIRDTFSAFVLAGRDTTSTTLAWLFCDEKNWRIFTAEESRGLVYLHGAICETLRLFPALSWQLQTSAKPDVLPSGHHIGANTKVLLSYYAMGRMEALWGKDCLEFRPERWISKRGEIESVPSYKFPAFNAGPRSCLGKEMPFIQMKMVAASILFKYKVRVVEDHPISPDRSIIIQMTHGLKVRLSRRDF
ncbi:hypothetical protein LIER_43048 [Lithospermum erythrorhizon]|uniref:Cytochrome P450 n=1 Tax=Lithospermum erythrorhizon TaxID=34254 RepID=A0AAV3PGP8_LITER